MKAEIRRRLSATVEEAFDAWTDPEGMHTWMCPGDVTSADVEMDLRAGGALRIVMNRPGGAIEHRGEFTVVDRPRKLAFTWIAAGLPQTLVTVEFRKVSATECELVLTHEGFLAEDVTDRYKQGWGKITVLLEQYLKPEEK